jgi:hypothetical protein
MNNFVIDTSNVDDDEFDSVYCTNCNSCGNWGCECWGGCSMLYCKYGPGLIEEYESMKKEINTYYNMLVELGIECPYDIDLFRVNQIAYQEIGCIDGRSGGSLYDEIRYYFYKLKDVEEE